MLRCIFRYCLRIGASDEQIRGGVNWWNVCDVFCVPYCCLALWLLFCAVITLVLCDAHQSALWLQVFCVVLVVSIFDNVGVGRSKKTLTRQEIVFMFKLDTIFSYISIHSHATNEIFTPRSKFSQKQMCIAASQLHYTSCDTFLCLIWRTNIPQLHANSNSSSKHTEIGTSGSN